MTDLNLSHMLLNITIPPSNCKCVVPEAVIPLQWRIMIILNLVFTLIVYLTFVLRGSETPSLKVMLEEIKKIDRAQATKFFRLLLWVVLFTTTLVIPWATPLYQKIQIGLIILLIFSFPN